MTTRACDDVVRRAPRSGRVHPLQALVATALTALVAFLGIGTQASATQVASRSAPTAYPTTTTTPQSGSTTSSDSRRSVRVASSATHASGRRIEAPRGAALCGGSGGTDGSPGHQPTQPATGGLDRTGPPVLHTACLASAPTYHLTARTTPVGAGRSPPSSCGS